MTPGENQSMVYCLHTLDQLTGETSVVKINSETLSCYELYQSKFNIVHLALQEQVDGDGGHEAAGGAGRAQEKTSGRKGAQAYFEHREAGGEDKPLHVD